MEFKIEPTKSKRKLTKQVMKVIEQELVKCDPNYVLTLDITIIEDRSAIIPEVMSKRKWNKLGDK